MYWYEEINWGDMNDYEAYCKHINLGSMITQEDTIISQDMENHQSYVTMKLNDILVN